MLKKNRKFKNCFITGISGSGGSYLAEYIKKKNENIKIFGTTRKNSFKLKKELQKIAKIEKLDLRNYSKLEKLLRAKKPDLIYHLASYADVRKSFLKPTEVIENNYQITINLLEAVKNLKINPLIIICSTSEVYGDVKKNQIPIRENLLMQPVSPYALSKCFQDLAAQVYYKAYKLNIIITRMFSYTNARRFNLFQSSFAKQIVDIEKGKKNLLTHGNLNSVRTLIDTDDALEAYWLAAKRGKIGEIYNISGKDVMSVKQVLKFLIKNSRKKIKSRQSKNLVRPKDITLQIASSKKFMKDTNWRPKIPANKSLIKLLNTLRNEK
jgi:GDP-4-dehydro-6-deoxy-D-mannose reductase